jgi:cell wall assembly regulator SMI1
VRRWGVSAFSSYVSFDIHGHPPFGGEGMLDVLYGLAPGNAYDLEANYEAFEDRMSHALLPVAQDPGGNQICISLRGPTVGRVLFWDHEGERDPEYGAEGIWENVWPVATTWGQFIQSLRPFEDSTFEN